MHRKIFSRQQLVRILNRQRNRKKIVFTNGCFDLLHAGHLRLLEQARRQGDILVVGLNSDRSLRRLKGADRPLVGEKYRALLLSALSCVDYVTVFWEETPSEIIRLLKPDVLVKGGDYEMSEIVGSDLVKKVVRVQLLKNFSTTGLIRKIVTAYGKKFKK